LAWASRNLVKFSVVPESLDRWTDVIVVPGSVAPLFAAAISGSFHLVIFPEKILARMSGVTVRSSAPWTL
jgi:hypothetical protein